jgi:hypothetical protein
VWGGGGGVRGREKEGKRGTGTAVRGYRCSTAISQSVYVCTTYVDYISIHGSSEGSIHGRTEF